MAHAEKCPICYGRGQTESKEKIGGTIVRKSDPCHGCNGKGWIEVGDDPVVTPVIPWPPHKPTITWGPWVYESGIYSANIEVLI